MLTGLMITKAVSGTVVFGYGGYKVGKPAVKKAISKIKRRGRY